MKRLFVALSALGVFALAPPHSAAAQQRDLNDPYTLAWLASYCRTETVLSSDPRKGLDLSKEADQWSQVLEAGLVWSVLYDRSLRTLSFDDANPPAGFGSCAAELPRVVREFQTLDGMYAQGRQTGRTAAKTPPAREGKAEALYDARWCEAVSQVHLGFISNEEKDKSYRRNVSDFLQYWSGRAASLSRSAGAGAAGLAQVEQRVREDFEEVQRILGPTPQRRSAWPGFVTNESRHCSRTLLALKLAGG